MLRSAWLAQEILSSFSDQIDELSLQPRSGGLFQILIGDKIVWCRKKQKGFPDAPTIKRIFRDHLDPTRDLGHIDRKS